MKATTRNRILIVDDDAVMRVMLGGMLREQGHTVGEAASASQAREMLRIPDWHLVLLDRRLPDSDGLLLIKPVKEKCGCPIIVLTSMGDEHDRMLGLGLGAVDYISKPFNPHEVRLRIHNLLNGQGRDLRVVSDTPVTYGPFTLVPATRTLKNNSEIQKLSPAETRLMSVFLNHAGKVFERKLLSEICCGREWSYEDRGVDVLVARLRRRIEPDPKEPKWILTLHGSGYYFARNFDLN